MTYQVANYFLQKAKSCNFHTSYFADWASTNGEVALKVGVEGRERDYLVLRCAD